MNALLYHSSTNWRAWGVITAQPIMANLRHRIPQQTESLFTKNHETFFNSIGQ